jgi:hypothetical protein
LDVLVNDVLGGEHLIEWNVPVWEHSLEGGLRMLSLAIDTHIITSRLRVGHFKKSSLQHMAMGDRR